MPSHYTQQALTVLSLFGVLAAIMASLSVILIFRVQDSVRQGEFGAGLGPGAGRFLLPASAVLAALCLAPNASCLLLCLLHSYFTAEVGRDDPESGRGDWFLLDNRSVRQSAICLFCLGIAVYLAAVSLYMLILFEIETGIASSCILTSSAIFMTAVVVHTLHKASQATRQSHDQLNSTLYENDSAHDEELTDSAPSSDLNNSKELSPVRPRPEIHREFSYPPFLQQQQKLQSLSPPHSNMTAISQGEHHIKNNGAESYIIPRMHRTLSVESGLMQPNPKIWNGVAQEMRNVVPRKPGVVGKDSTLV
ncbi:transmembrane protein 221 S homeolog [Xenopus laevis]|uniref:Jiraiya n=1 Tax=Xenopus laevis TaxID=8355 RepID=D9N395_XENLA|nr:transmembrane protein 221 S homeolog [Xenopus laevis]BAJ14649.1 Jiraiya [Xenopus laevis]